MLQRNFAEICIVLHFAREKKFFNELREAFLRIDSSSNILLKQFWI